MIKARVSLSLMVAFLFISGASALVAGPSKIIGSIKSFDEKAVIVENDEHSYQVPKDLVGEKNLKAGAKIEILLSQDQVDKVKVEKKKSAKK